MKEYPKTRSEGMALIAVLTFFSKMTRLVDSCGRLVALLANVPTTESALGWQSVASSAFGPARDKNMGSK